jgi:TatD DNase family protein
MHSLPTTSCGDRDLVDTHCHLTAGQLAPRADAVIAAALAAGVTRLVNVACDPAEWEAAARLCERYPQHLRLAAGIHPHEAARAGEEHFRRLAELWRAEGVVGCGEMGLDYHYDFSPRPRQQAVFARQLELAGDTGLPIIIHSREAHDDVVRLLEEHGCRGRRVVFHCFSGTREQAAELWSRGWSTSFTGTVTYRKSQEQQATCAATPAGELMFETDAPYLSPEPVRRMHPNEPANLVHTVRFAAALRGLPFETLAAQSTANAARFFAW